MFILHTSNKTENLLEHLVQVIRSQPLRSPFAREHFLIQSQGMERWLSQQLASRFQVWANFEFLFPARFFSGIGHKLHSNTYAEAFEREHLLWHFLALLNQLDTDALSPLRHYLAGDNQALKQFQLAQQLTQLFDQYQIMRPDMLAAWQAGQLVTQQAAEVWQQALWRKLVATIGEQHRGTVWLNALDTLAQTPIGQLKQLPDRISIFGVNTLPPIFLQLLNNLARHTQVHLYLLNPTQTYWADLETRKRTARRKLRQASANQGDDGMADPVKHPLLAALAQQGRELQAMLLELAEFELELDSFESETGDRLSNLQRLQRAILDNRPDPQTLRTDGSIRIHSCHSRMREVMVLKDQLLQTLHEDPTLDLRDIIVMAPDIQLYSPFITAVFDDIQHSIADRDLRANSQLLDTFARFLRLSQSRLGWQSVLDILEQPVVYPGFDLSDTDLELIRHWVLETRVRWGQSGAHKQALDLPALDANTWQTALDRLLMGYALGDEQDFVQDVLPFSAIEGTAAQALGGLSEYLQLLFRASAELKQPRTLHDWSIQLNDYAEQLFAGDTIDSTEWQTLTGLLADLSHHFNTIHTDTVELDVIIAWLESTLSECKSSSGFLRGHMTFCSMLPMRSIPFKVIALLGMAEGEFPKVERPATFDLLNHDYRKGDRSRRADDRYQFLEILLSVRNTLLITYTGQSIHKNTPIPPSAVVSELLEVMTQDYGLTDLVVQHRLQPFSQHYFSDKTPDLFSYSSSHCAIARSLQHPPRDQARWWRNSLATEPTEAIDLADLFAFFRHPQKYFVQRQLGVHLNQQSTEPDEREWFELPRLVQYQLDQDWIRQQLHTGSGPNLAQLNAAGEWLPGTPGQLLFQTQQKAIQAFTDRIDALNLGAQRIEPIDLQLAQYRLLGNLSGVHEKSSFFYRYAALKGRDFFRVWLHHLLINQIQRLPTRLLTRDYELLLPPELATPETLLSLIDLYQQGRQTPSSLFIEPALAFLKQAAQAKKRNSPLQKARTKLGQALEKGYEPEIALLYRHAGTPNELLDELLGETFESCCTAASKVWLTATTQQAT